MPDTPTKLTLKADWGIAESRTGKRLHGRIYRSNKDGGYMFVSAAYDGAQVQFRAWPCNRNGEHERLPRYTGTDTTIGRFLSRHGYLNVETGEYPREARLTDLAEDTADDGSPMEIATYHVSPPIGSANPVSSVEVVTKYVGANSNIRAVRITYPDGACDITESIGWDTDAQALGKLGISVIDPDEPDWSITGLDLLEDAMRRNRDDGDIVRLGGGNWDTILDIRTDRPELTAWTDRWVYKYTVNGDGLGGFVAAPRNPRLPRNARANRAAMIRTLFIEGASGTYSPDDAAALFDQWLKDERDGMGLPLDAQESAHA